ncbi:alpha/beta hydrolase, partial [Terrisporobacter sp.]|uniref:alpha/beta hydrolase n=1 Tax=Terrisporobacter sp. TaxID=1965305 RepID=UPI002A83BCCF
LGGVMASKYASTHKNIKALALYASYPSGDELKDSNIEVVSIYGSKDGVVNKENLDESKENLPDGSEFIEIKGGNHSQFGDYGLQNGDNKATISEEKQFNYTAKYTTELLDKIK